MEDEKPVHGFGAWYDEKQGEDGDLWHRTLIDPALWDRIGEVTPGIRVVDVGCGNGYVSRRLARAGARVVGVDRSRALIARARAREEQRPLGIVYHVADAGRLGMLRARSFDLAVANMSLMDIENAEGAIHQVGRLLRPGGRFVFSISHPCFDVDTRSAWQVEQRAGQLTVFRKVTDYRRPHADTFRWPLPDGRTAATRGYHRPLTWYVKQLRSSGLLLVDLEEPLPSSEFVGRTVQRSWLEEVPLHLVVESRRESVGPDDARSRRSGGRR